jgi:hypothetical protein
MYFDKQLLNNLYGAKNIIFTSNKEKMRILVDLQVLRIRAEKSDPVFNVKNYIYVIGNEIFYEIKSYLIKEGRQNKLFGINVLIDYYNSKDYRLLKEVY